MKLFTIALMSLVALPLGSGLGSREDALAEVEAVITDFHAAAAEGDADRYFGHMAPDAVLLGTDATERWSYEEYVALARPHLEQGGSIVNRPGKQNVYIAEGGDMAWFDEELEKPKYGEMRASGVLRHTDDGWKIVQFHLTFPIPNEIVPDVIKLRRAANKKR